MHFELIKNKTVLLRCDFNEPMENGMLMSTKRIDANILTINELLARKNKIIIISHHSNAGQTLLPVFNYLEKSFQGRSRIKYLNTMDQNIVKEYFDLNKNIYLVDFNNPESENIILLENTRLFGDGLDENNDSDFAKFLASLADCFVYDAFSVAHRSHASTVGVASILPSCFGPTFLKEYRSLKKITSELGSSLIFMGGAKLSTKLPLVDKFLNSGATVCLGGAMLHPILNNLYLKAKENNNNTTDPEAVIVTGIKDSYMEKDFILDLDELEKLNKKIKESKLLLPKELIWQNSKIVDNIFDFENIKNIIIQKNIKNILWNGPVGMYEEGYIKGSQDIYDFIKEINNKIFTVVGGGDTIAFLESTQKENNSKNTEKEESGEEESDFEQDFSYVSLSGGAMLEFLSTGTLPILSHILHENVI